MLTTLADIFVKIVKEKKSFQQLQMHHLVGSQDISTLKKDSSNIRNIIVKPACLHDLVCVGASYIYTLKVNFFADGTFCSSSK